MSTINVNGVDLDTDTAIALSDAARKAASDLGYCSESSNVIGKMGLPLPTVKVTVSFYADADKAEQYAEQFADPDHWSIRQDYTGVSGMFGKEVTVGKVKHRVRPTS